MIFLEVEDRKSGMWINELSTVLDEELLDYFARLNEFPAFQELRLLDPFEDTFFEPPRRHQLKTELATMAPLVERRELPEPPTYVGLEETGDIRVGDELGWPGLQEFLTRLHRLLLLAEHPDMELWAIGE